MINTRVERFISDISDIRVFRVLSFEKKKKTLLYIYENYLS